MFITSQLLEKINFDIFFNGNLFVDIVSRTSAVIMLFCCTILFLLNWFFERYTPTYLPKQKSKNILKKLLLIDFKKVVPNYFIVCNIIAFVATLLLMVVSIIHIILVIGITSGIFRIFILLYLVALFIQAYSLFKYNFIKK